MKFDVIHSLGSPSLERVGISPNSAEMSQIASDRMEPREIGHRRVSLWQCLCLRLNRQSATSCESCGREKPAERAR